MFLAACKLLKKKDIILATKPVYSYGLYRWWFLGWLYKHSALSIQEIFSPRDMLLFKYYAKIVMENLELDLAVKTVNIQVKKSLQTYQGLRLHLDLPVRGQRTWTNASTQRLLAHNPRRRHFVQRWNWRKFAIKEQKWLQQRNRNKAKNEK